MVVVKWSDKVEGSGYNIDSPLCGGFYKEEDNYLVTWSGTDPYTKMNCFTWSKVLMMLLMIKTSLLRL